MAAHNSHAPADLSSLDKLISHQSQHLAESRANVARLRKFYDEYAALRRRVSSLTDKLQHPATVRLSRLAFMPGRLVHTNQLLVLLGDNWFCKCTASHAISIIDRRLKQCNEWLSKAEGEVSLLSAWRDKTDDAVASSHEIHHPFDEQHEKEWRERRRGRVAEERRRENRARGKSGDHDKLMARLDQLRLQELAASVDHDSSPALSRTCETLSVDADKSVSSQCDLDSDDSSTPPSSLSSSSSSCPTDDDDADETANTSTAPAKTKRVTFGEASASQRSTVMRAHSTKSKSILKAAADSNSQPATDATSVGQTENQMSNQHVDSSTKHVKCSSAIQRPELSEVFSYKIVERNVQSTAGATPASDNVLRENRPVSRFRLSRNRGAL